NAFSSFQRIPGDNIRNYGVINFNAQITRELGIEAGYANTFFDYEDHGGNADFPSRSGLLDRVEHMIHVDGRWMIQPQTIGVVGYQFREVNYTGDEEIGLRDDGSSIVSSDRDS